MYECGDFHGFCFQSFRYIFSAFKFGFNEELYDKLIKYGQAVTPKLFYSQS